MRAISRKQELITLLEKQTQYLPVKELAKILNVSERTVHNDLKILQQDGYMLEKKPRYGILLKSRNMQVSKKIKNDFSIPENRRLSIIKELLFDKNHVTIEELSEKYYVGSSSVLVDLQHIRENYTNVKTAKLISDIHGTRFVGSEEEMQRLYIVFNEKQIRESASVIYTKELRQLFYQWYETQLVDTCLDVIESFKQYTLYSVAQHYIFNVANILIVLIYRIRKGYHHEMVHNAFNVDEVMGLNFYLIAKDLLEIVKQKLTIDYKQADIYFLSIYLQANRIQFIANSQSYQKEYEDSIRSMIDKMSKNVGIDLQQNEELYKNISLHITHMKYRLEKHILITNPLLKQIKEEFRLMFDLTWLVLEEEKERLGISLIEDEVGFLMLHFQSAIDNALKSKKILVVCPNGYTTSNFIINRIRRVLPPLDILEAASIDEVDRFDLEKIDLIISTIPLTIKDKTVIVVSSLITNYDIENIARIYNTKIIEQPYEYEIKNAHIKDLLKESFVFVNDNVISKEEVIQIVCEKLLTKGYVKEGYEKSVLERETKGGTGIATMAAVPHGDMSLVVETQIAIWINKTPIRWGKYGVKVIIFFCLAKPDLKKAKLILEDIFSLIKSKEQIEKEIAVLTKKEIYELITGGK